MTRMLRIPDSAHEMVVELVKLRGGSMTAVVSDAIERAYHEAFWESATRQVEHTRRTEAHSWASYRGEADDWASGDEPLREEEWGIPASSKDAS